MSPAREIAYRVLMKTAKGGYATDLLRREQADPRDLALAESIVLGCLRHQSQLDHLITVFSGKTAKLDKAKQFIGYQGDAAHPSSVLFLHHGIHLDLQINPQHPIGQTDPAGVSDLVVEAALSTILDLEDSIAAVDADEVWSLLPALRDAVLAGLRADGGAEVGELIVERITGLTPEARKGAMTLLLEQAGTDEARRLDAVEHIDRLDRAVEVDGGAGGEPGRVDGARLLVLAGAGLFGSGGCGIGGPPRCGTCGAQAGCREGGNDEGSDCV